MLVSAAFVLADQHADWRSRNAPVGAAGTEKVQGIKVRTFARPEAVSAEHAYATDPWTVYATASEETVKLDALRGRCVVSLDDAVLSGACCVHLCCAAVPGNQRPVHEAV